LLLSNCNASLFSKGSIANLLREGLIENGIFGVINRRNGCGTTLAFQEQGAG
jgi:hypothetical protein